MFYFDHSATTPVHPDVSELMDSIQSTIYGNPSSIYCYGNRNPQGLAFDSSGRLWELEHGPKGGDELNIIEKGKNYGWPVITYGVNYNVTKITDITHKKGMEQPIWHWTPSIAVCGMKIYECEKFYPSFQQVLFEDTSPKEAIQFSKFEIIGRA